MNIINNNVVWSFNEQIEQNYEDAMNFLTKYKCAYNEKRNIEYKMLTQSHLHTKIYIDDKTAPKMQLFLNLMDDQSTQYNNMILERNEKILQEYNNNCEKYLNDIKIYNQYKYQGEEFLKSNNLITTFDIGLLMSKTKMEDYTLQMYRNMTHHYERLFELQNNKLYTVLPFMKPRSYNIDLKYYKDNMIRYANNLNTIFYHFPSVREYVSNELKRLYYHDIMYKAAKELAMKQYNDELYNAVKELDIKKGNRLINMIKNKLQIVDVLNKNDKSNNETNLTTENEYDRKMMFINNLTNTKIVLDTNSSVNDILNALTFVLV